MICDTICVLVYLFNYFLVRDAFVRTNRGAIPMMFVRLYVRLSVCDGPALWSYGVRYRRFKFMDG